MTPLLASYRIPISTGPERPLKLNSQHREDRLCFCEPRSKSSSVCVKLSVFPTSLPIQTRRPSPHLALLFASRSVRGGRKHHGRVMSPPPTATHPPRQRKVQRPQADSLKKLPAYETSLPCEPSRHSQVFFFSFKDEKLVASH